MLLTFLIDPPFVLLLGYLFALSIPLTSRRPLARTDAFRAGLLTFTLFCLAAAVAFWWYPDWMWMYFATVSTTSKAVQGLHLLLGLIVYYVLYCLGFLWGARARARVGVTAWWGVAMLGVASVLIILPFFARYYHVGTTAEFLAGGGIPLPQSPLALIYNVTMPAMAVVGLLGFLRARKER